MRCESGAVQARRAGGLALLVLAVGLILLLWESDPQPLPPGGAADSAAEQAAPELAAQGDARPEPAQPAIPPAPQPVAARDVRIVGRVVGADYRPRGGLPVSIRASDRPEQTTSTRPDGSFEVAFGRRPASQVHVTALARSGDRWVGSVAGRINPIGPERHELGTITLGEAVDMRVRVVRAGRPVVGARVYASAVRVADATRSQAWQGKPWSGWSHDATSDDQGIAVLRRLPAGAVRLLGVAEGPLRGEANVRADTLVEPFVLELTRARHLRVEVVRAGDGAPVPGCQVGAVGPERLLEEPWPRPVTDEHGVAVLQHAPNTRIELLIAGPDWASAYLKMPRYVPPDVTTFRTEVPQAQVLRVPIEVADGALPEDGTRVALENGSWAWWPGTRTWLPREGVVRNGLLELARRGGIGWIRALARLPDGRVGTLHLRPPTAAPLEKDDGSGRVVFHAPRTLTVHVTERGTDAPAVGVAVTLSVPHARSLRIGPVLTDKEGNARLTGAPPALGEVQICSNPQWVARSRQHVFAATAPVDLRHRDADMALQVEPIVDAVVKVITNGRAGFPDGMDMQLFYWPQGVDGVRPGGLQLDPEHGELRFRVRLPIARPEPPLRLSHNGGQVLHVRIASVSHATQTVQLEYEAGRRRLAGAVDLVRSGELITRVRTPKGSRLRFQLERYESTVGWIEERLPALVAFAGEAGQERYAGLRPGRYRLKEVSSGEVSPQIDVRAGGGAALLVWELGALEYAEGEVILPPGVDPEGLRVMGWDEKKPPSAGIVTGTHFKILVSGDRPLKLFAIHPQCKPPADAKPVVVTEPEKGLQLRLELR